MNYIWITWNGTYYNTKHIKYYLMNSIKTPDKKHLVHMLIMCEKVYSYSEIVSIEIDFLKNILTF